MTPAEPLVVAVSEVPAGLIESLVAVPEEELGTQRIVKFHYQGQEGDGTLNLVLRLERRDRFSIQGNDRLGRSWFRLAVDGPQALFLDLRDRTFCRFSRALEISAVPLGPLPFDQLPALLLGRLPAPGARVLAANEETVELSDAADRRWTVTASGGRVERWTLWEGSEPAVWWFHDGELAYLSSRSDQLQLRWRLGRGKPLSRSPDTLELPEGFVAGTNCSDDGLVTDG